ncbi:MAG TPA: NAD(P)H-binding protein [Polyangiaceae bacterium]|nr:NAD(P)H-binding protein [Polyangiaceae bacterium]
MVAMARQALLAGATGLVGRELADQLAASEQYDTVHVLVRRAVPQLASKPKLVEHVVDFDALPSLPATDDVYVALGTTIKVAGSEQAFRRVDYDYVLAVARKGRAAGARRLGVVSALGADEKSRVFYNRVKGEMQEAVTELGYDSVVIAQPSLLLGDREALGQPTRAGEVWARRLFEPVSGLIPARVRPVRARAVAAALLGGVLAAPPGVSFVENRAML